MIGMHVYYFNLIKRKQSATRKGVIYDRLTGEIHFARFGDSHHRGIIYKVVPTKPVYFPDCPILDPERHATIAARYAQP